MDMYKITLGDGKEEERGALYGNTVLGIERTTFGRYRDCWVEVDENGVLRIAVYTRNGGGNRPDYEAVTENLRAHPCYLLDRDDKFDTTYATYYFRFPPVVPEHIVRQQATTQAAWDQFFEITKLRAHPEPIDTDQRWHDAIAALEKDGPTDKQIAGFAPVAEALKKVIDGENKGGIVYMDGTTEPFADPEEGS